MKKIKPTLSAHIPHMLRAMFALMMVVAACMWCSAAEPLSGPALRVHLSSGEIEMYLLANEPVITFADDHCLIKSSDFSADYEMAKIDHADFVADASSGIEDQEISIIVDLSDPEAVTVYGLESNAPLSLYSIAGVALGATKADESGTASISLAGLQAGVYIVTTNQTTFKIYRK